MGRWWWELRKQEENEEEKKGMGISEVELLEEGVWKKDDGEKLGARKGYNKEEEGSGYGNERGQQGERIRSRNCKQYCREQGGRKRAGEKDAREEG